MPVILLEHPRPENPNRFEDVVNAPLSACLFTGYIAAVFRKHKIETEIINAHLYDWSIEQTIVHLSKRLSPLLCVHMVYLWERTHDVFDMLSVIKSKNNRVHINLYGYYPTFAHKKILTDFPSIDSVTIGEPEFISLDLARCILSQRGILHSPSPEDISYSPFFRGGIRGIDGLARRDKSGEVIFHPRHPIQEIDQLPYPDRQDIELYKKKNIATYIQGSRGCYGRCTFCYLNPFYGQISQWRSRSVKNIVDEMLILHREYSIGNFYFSDANFFGPGKSGRERAITLAELILINDLNIHFGFECRVNDIEEYSLSRLVMAGLTKVFLGLESGDPESLKRIKKHTTVDENKKAIQLLRDYGIEPTFGFIMFEPHSTLESVRNNFEFLKEVEIMTSPAVTAHLLHHRQTLFEGTPDYQSVMHETSNPHTSFTRYEALYKIQDQKIEAFSEIITAVCRAALSFIPKDFDCDGTKTSNTTVKSSSFDTVNNELITLFEKTLSGFEAHTIDYYNSDKVKEVSQKLISEIEANMQSSS
ncbi:MAG: Mg-protoporphyrin IX monomethyl ester oxidative cyclase (anaerobic) [Candidatus Jettenia ecosi]|uniref:Mg-protoporphyrin IX monomethyl ester oxidative cyclase (Anaerobic) n=1 Tax=Candidatus Jettenia ecosi TaxID=2494326 RepID=A0A533QC62_9BACT|nr:MAG: Mg-protoporphyrin IX monomethyl ester oxidative cyclase (anaerobic) [Candidatus Jettenia ecosi]